MSVQKRFLIFLLASAIFLFLPKKVLADVLLNELLPNPSSPPDWVELYNGDDEAVDLEGWSLVDSTSEMLIIHEATISAHGFLVFDVTNRLNQSNDTIRLLNQTSEEQDSYEYTSNPGTNVSYGRMPDGKSWGICQVPTKGGPNSCVVPTPTPTPAPTNTPTPGPTNTPTPTPIPPTPTPTKKLTPTLTPTPTPTAMPTLTPTPTGEVLGEETPPEEQPRRNLLPFILIGSGLLLLFGSAVPLILPKFKKGDILKKDEKNQKVD